MSAKSIMSVTLSPRQVASACEQYVRERTLDNEGLTFNASLPAMATAVVQISKKRVRKAKAKEGA